MLHFIFLSHHAIIHYVIFKPTLRIWIIDLYLTKTTEKNSYGREFNFDAS